MRGVRTALVVVAFGAILSSCSSDPAALIQKSEATRSKVLGAIAADSAMTGQMADLLLQASGARDIVVEKVASNGEAMQALMAKLARDPVAVDGIIGFAVQDSTMKQHVLTLLKGIEIGGGRR